MNRKYICEIGLFSLFWWLWKYKKVWKSYLQFKSQTVSDKSLISDPPNFAFDTHWKQKPAKFLSQVQWFKNLSVVLFWFFPKLMSSTKRKPVNKNLEIVCRLKLKFKYSKLGPWTISCAKILLNRVWMKIQIRIEKD